MSLSSPIGLTSINSLICLCLLQGTIPLGAARLGGRVPWTQCWTLQGTGDARKQSLKTYFKLYDPNQILLALICP